jgi:hypothetical protein
MTITTTIVAVLRRFEYLTERSNVCFKNREGASTAMDADILQEEFSYSETMQKPRLRFLC